MRQIILDTETTGLTPKDGHRIIEIGCLEMVNRRLTSNKLHFYINPERDIERGAQKVHGITNEFLQEKPKFADIYHEFLAFLKGAELVIHNAPFDIGFINAECKRVNSQFKLITHYCTVIDTLAIARKNHPGQQNSLDALCRRYHVDNSNRDLHGALLDASLLAQVYLLMTGGQAQLFVESKTNTSAHNSKIHPQRIDRTNQQKLKVINPTSEEMIAHEKFMAFLKGN